MHVRYEIKYIYIRTHCYYLDATYIIKQKSCTYIHRAYLIFDLHIHLRSDSIKAVYISCTKSRCGMEISVH